MDIDIQFQARIQAVIVDVQVHFNDRGENRVFSQTFKSVSVVENNASCGTVDLG